eukprot:NODE_1672_length_1096_cov_16.766953_g1366_i0.p1 GENE.NODE_1672_length_1096_cov_16.766953_g1366_i0~~NODE_1672_length_1096_cov_16.766953_g1366_i0.p1  ORF type:complete len:196 (-),score=17.06 NODE_1672_length_1096_cov_16.766953_g1366_i0:212-799(-)
MAGLQLHPTVLLLDTDVLLMKISPISSFIKLRSPHQIHLNFNVITSKWPNHSHINWGSERDWRSGRHLRFTGAASKGLLRLWWAGPEIFGCTQLRCFWDHPWEQPYLTIMAELYKNDISCYPNNYWTGWNGVFARHYYRGVKRDEESIQVGRRVLASLPQPRAPTELRVGVCNMMPARDPSLLSYQNRSLVCNWN